MSQRFDSGILKRPRRLASGFLRTDAFVTRIGVFNYLDADGSSRRELRHPDEVFSADSLDSLAMLPVTAEHPPELLSAENARKFSIGTTGENARQDNRFVRSTVQVQDAKTIAKIEKGMRELSCGYRCDKDETPGVTQGIPGVPDGLNYDLIQRNIQYNHIALTANGRAGPECSVPRMDGMDSDTAVMMLDSDNPHPNSGKQSELPWSGTMDATIRIDGIEYKTTEQAAQAFRQFSERTDKEKAELQTKVTDAEKALEKEKARADASEEKAKKAETERADALKPEAIQSRITERVALEQIGSRVLGEKTEDGKEIKLAGMSDLEIQKAVIVKTAPDANLDGKSEDYISARYDHAVESLPKDENTDADRKRAAVHKAATGPKGDEVTDAASARQRMIERQEKAWMPKEQPKN